MWRRAVASFAEGIAKALYSQRSTNDRGPATPLTQDRRREAKGVLFRIDKSKPPRIESSCRLCGDPIRHGQKYCRNCTTIVAKENILNAARLRRQNTHSPEARARNSETQRRQNAALRNWNPTEKPSWLDETTYKERVQPKLSRIIVRRIASALSISEPYALRIRSRRCIPHPRHWIVLARLVGIYSPKP